MDPLPNIRWAEQPNSRDKSAGVLPARINSTTDQRRDGVAVLYRAAQRLSRTGRYVPDWKEIVGVGTHSALDPIFREA